MHCETKNYQFLCKLLFSNPRRTWFCRQKRRSPHPTQSVVALFTFVTKQNNIIKTKTLLEVESCMLCDLIIVPRKQPDYSRWRKRPCPSQIRTGWWSRSHIPPSVHSKKQKHTQQTIKQKRNGTNYLIKCLCMILLLFYLIELSTAVGPFRTITIDRICLILISTFNIHTKNNVFCLILTEML